MNADGATYGKEPAVSNSIAQGELTFVGLDVHKDSISVGILQPGAEVPVADRIFHDEPSVRRLVAGFDRARLRVCYEAGPTGYGLARLFESMGIDCNVVAPSLIPTAPGDRVKTDKRDARRLARLLRAGELTFIRVPTEVEEGVRDLCRIRDDAVIERRRARQRLASFLLRHGRVFRDGSAWTLRHGQWLSRLSFDEPAAAATFGHYRAMLAMADTVLAGIEADLAPWCQTDPFAGPVARLAAYRGIRQVGGLVLVAEVCDFRRFPRAGAFMGFTGLVPSEYSSGGTQRRGHVTKAGNGFVRRQLVESAWAYQHRPAVGARLKARQDGLPPATIARSWKAQQRLCGRFRALAARKDSKTVVATAIARELAGFVWAEMTAND
jgi:transposase